MDINNNRAGKRGRCVGGVATTTAVGSKRHKNELQQNCAKTPINLSKVEAQKRNENSKGKALKERGGGEGQDCNKQREKDGRTSRCVLWSLYHIICVYSNGAVRSGRGVATGECEPRPGTTSGS